MSVRITLKEGDVASELADAIVSAAIGDAIALGEAAVAGAGEIEARFVIHAAAKPPGGAASEASVRSAMRSALARARELGVKTIAVPALGAGSPGLSVQRCAEVLIEEARAHAARETSLEEIRFVLLGEPAYRMFEMVNDAARVAEQMTKLRQRARPAN
jgi:O-acetyl-ADP-ribose deacetylase (regulator of RNase III)